MKTRAVLTTVALLAAFTGILAAFMLGVPRRPSPPSQGLPGQTNLPSVAREITERSVPASAANHAERLLKLEQLGQLPNAAEPLDWVVAQKTTWWGKRLDPKVFWKDRPIWNDRSATKDAERHGREYPPMPYDDPAFASRSDQDSSTLPSADSLDVRYRRSDRESAFWDAFTRSHPRSPEDITSMQFLVAKGSLGSRYAFEHEGNRVRTTEARLAAGDELDRKEMVAAGYPAEAFTDEALRWAYVAEKRSEYERRYVQRHNESTLIASRFLAHIYVDPKLITDPMTDKQLKAANAWKIACLQRLRKENTDESYINAYLAAWNLSPAAVFGGTNGP